MNPGSFVSPHLEYAQLWPMLVLFAAACLGVAVEAFVPRAQRFVVQVGLSGTAVLVALVGTVVVGHGLPVLADTADLHARGMLAAGGAMAMDGPTVFLQGLVLVCALAGVLLIGERRLGGGVTAFAGAASAVPGSGAERRASDAEHTETFPLLLFAVGGMVLFTAAHDLMMLFIALEVLSLPLYLLTGLARRRRLLSQEAALKYFLLGAFSSAILLYGVALVYGATGTLEYSRISQALQPDADSALGLIGIALVAVGVLFKVGAVPFHAWTPDVYQGAPTPLVAFMSAATKVAAFGALMRLFYAAFSPAVESWRPMLWAVAVATMLLGAVVALAQTEIKRMLGYSAIAHSGFVLTGVIGVSATGVGIDVSIRSVLFYLTAYAVAVIGSFATASLVRDAGGEAGSLSAWEGLGRRSPVVAGVFAIFMLSLAGVPLTAGFIAKWGVISAAAGADAWLVVGVALAASLIALVAYLRVLVVLYFRDPTPVTAAVARPSWMTSSVIGFCALATVVLGLVPGPLLDLLVRLGLLIG